MFAYIPINSYICITINQTTQYKPNQSNKIRVQLQVSFGEAVKRAFSQYCCFSGRASRSEYWWFYLFNILIVAALQIMQIIVVGGAAAGGSYGGAMAGVGIFVVLQWIWCIVALLPGLGLFVRRLHDIGKGGGWIFIGLIPIVGAIVLLVFACQESEMQPNRFGEVPNARN